MTCIVSYFGYIIAYIASIALYQDDPLEDDDEIEEQAMRIALCEVAGPLMQSAP